MFLVYIEYPQQYSLQDKHLNCNLQIPGRFLFFDFDDTTLSHILGVPLQSSPAFQSSLPRMLHCGHPLELSLFLAQPSHSIPELLLSALHELHQNLLVALSSFLTFKSTLLVSYKCFPLGYLLQIVFLGKQALGWRIIYQSVLLESIEGRRKDQIWSEGEVEL